MSFLNKLRAFGEWYEADSCLDDAITAASKKEKAFQNSQGKCFTDFAKDQSESVYDILIKLSSSHKEASEIMKPASDVLQKMKTELARLKVLNDDIRVKKKETDTFSDRAKSSTKKAEALQKKLETLRGKNPSSPDLTRVQEDYDVALGQQQTDTANAEQRQTQFNTESTEYKRQLFICILNTLELYANAKQSVTSRAASIGDQMADLGATIPEIDDPGLGIILTQLESLRNEPND